jgi:hypothetical protein
MIGQEIPVASVRGTMWATKPQPPSTLNSIILSAEAAMFWTYHNSVLTDKGLPGATTHVDGKRVCTHIYMKQTHDGCIIAGGDRIVETNSHYKSDYPVIEECV